MKTLADYVLGIRKEHKFKLKFLFEIGDADAERIENHLEKYELIEMGEPVKSIFMRNAIGWTKPINSEVYVIDVVLGMAASPFQLQNELADLFYSTLNNVAVVPASHDIENQLGIMNSPEDYQVLTDSDPEYKEAQEIDHSDYYGDEYNKKMIDSLKETGKQIENEIFKKTIK